MLFFPECFYDDASQLLRINVLVSPFLFPFTQFPELSLLIQWKGKNSLSFTSLKYNLIKS